MVHSINIDALCNPVPKLRDSRGAPTLSRVIDGLARVTLCNIPLRIFAYSVVTRSSQVGASLMVIPGRLLKSVRKLRYCQMYPYQQDHA